MTQEHFDKAAGEWDQKKRRQELAKAIAKAIGLLPLNKNMKAMEYGCGTGLVGLSLAPRLGSLTMVDTSTGMLEVLQDKINELGFENVSSRHLDLTVDSFDEHFDLIFSAMTLHHIEDTEQILRNLGELLNDNGYLVIADLDSEDGSFHSAGAGEKHHGFGRKALAATLTNLGFSSIQFETVHTISKTGDDHELQTYPVFLLTAQKFHVF